MELIRTVEREFETGPRAVLHLEARSGAVVVEGRDSDQVRVEAVIRIHTDLNAEADDAAALVERNMELDGHRVIIRTPSLHQENQGGWTALFGQRGASVDYRVHVPRRCAVRVLSRSGSVQVARVEGVVHTEALSGKLTIEAITGDVTAVSRSGSIVLGDITGNVQVEARSGRLRVSGVTGTLQADARSGQIEVQRIGGDVRVSASSGSLTIEHPAARVQAKSRAGSVRFKGAVQGDVDIEALAGSILFAVDSTQPFYLDAESHVGSVKSELPPRPRGFVPPKDGPKVRLRSRAGSIRITAM